MQNGRITNQCPSALIWHVVCFRKNKLQTENYAKGQPRRKGTIHARLINPTAVEKLFVLSVNPAANRKLWKGSTQKKRHDSCMVDQPLRSSNKRKSTPINISAFCSQFPMLAPPFEATARLTHVANKDGGALLGDGVSSSPPGPCRHLQILHDEIPSERSSRLTRRCSLRQHLSA
jgi:hypothetical protein